MFSSEQARVPRVPPASSQAKQQQRKEGQPPVPDPAELSGFLMSLSQIEVRFSQQADSTTRFDVAVVGSLLELLLPFL